MKKVRLVLPDYCYQEVMQKYVWDLREDNQKPVHGIAIKEHYGNDLQLWIEKDEKTCLEIKLENRIVPDTSYLYMSGDVLKICHHRAIWPVFVTCNVEM